MQRKVCPDHCQSVFLFQSFDTPGDEVAPRSDEIAEDFKNLSCFHNYFYDLRGHDLRGHRGTIPPAKARNPESPDAAESVSSALSVRISFSIVRHAR